MPWPPRLLRMRRRSCTAGKGVADAGSWHSPRGGGSFARPAPPGAGACGGPLGSQDRDPGLLSVYPGSASHSQGCALHPQPRAQAPALATCSQCHPGVFDTGPYAASRQRCLLFQDRGTAPLSLPPADARPLTTTSTQASEMASAAPPVLTLSTHTLAQSPMSRGR